MSSRDAILARIRSAITDAPAPAPIVRDYLPMHVRDDHLTLIDLLAENLTDYRARVHRSTEAELPAMLARLLAEHGSHSVALPTRLPPHWLHPAPRAPPPPPPDGPPTPRPPHPRDRGVARRPPP